MTHSKIIGRRQFIKGVAAGTVVFAAPYLLLPRKSALAQVTSSRAFIGAQGFGAGANGWRSPSAQIVFVTNLNNSGAGSLRQAIEGVSGPRYIIFRVAGYITITTPQLTTENNPGNGGNFYLAGQTAPGGGITIRANGTNFYDGILMLRDSQICVRHIRCRQRFGADTGGLRIAGLGNQSNLIIDHASVTWASDDNLPLSQSNDLVTYQYCLSAESPKAMLMWNAPSGASGKRVSAHHNYMAHCFQRHPENGGGDNEIINNLIYNWGECNSPGMCMDFYNIKGLFRGNVINTLAKWGPTSGYSLTCDPNLGFEIRNNNAVPANGGSIYMSGNRAHLPSGLVNARVKTDGGGMTVLGSPHSFTPAVPVTIHAADTLSTTLLPNVGCTKPARDSVDQAIVDSYAAFTGNSTISNENQTVGGNPFPVIASGTPDHLEPSGMTQEFINRMGLSNTVASALSTSISQARGLGEDYQNIEWNLMEKAGDIAPLGGGSNPPPAAPINLQVS